MRLGHRNWKMRTLGLVAVLVGAGTVAGANSVPAGAQAPASAPLAITLAQPTPPSPGVTATPSQWAQYAALWNGALHGGVKSVTWNGSACPVVSFQALAVPTALAQSAGDGSSTMDGFAMTVRCPVDSTSTGSASATRATSVSVP